VSTHRDTWQRTETAPKPPWRCASETTDEETERIGGETDVYFRLLTLFY